MDRLLSPKSVLYLNHLYTLHFWLQSILLFFYCRETKKCLRHVWHNGKAKNKKADPTLVLKYRGDVTRNPKTVAPPPKKNIKNFLKNV